MSNSGDMDNAFWKGRELADFSQSEWEALCDGCGRCCLNKLEDWDTGDISWTNLACSLLDTAKCSCRDYENRFAKIPDCVLLTPEIVSELTWLPPTCAYRLIDEGRDLYWWHPLVSGSLETVHDAGISVRGRVVSEVGIPQEEFEDHVVEWPGITPRKIDSGKN